MGVENMGFSVSRQRQGFQESAQFNPTRLSRTPWLVILAAVFNLTLMSLGTTAVVWVASSLIAGCDRHGTPPTSGHQNAKATSNPTVTATAGLIAEDELATTQVCSIAGVVNAKATSSDTFEIARRDVNAILDTVQQKGASALAEGRLAKARSSTGRAGIRIVEMGSRAACGLQKDDLLLAVDGVSVNDKGALSRHRTKLVSAPHARIDIERAGELKQLTYAIVD